MFLRSTRLRAMPATDIYLISRAVAQFHSNYLMIRSQARYALLGLNAGSFPFFSYSLTLISLCYNGE